jgi:hypothetical protein
MPKKWHGAAADGAGGGAGSAIAGGSAIAFDLELQYFSQRKTRRAMTRRVFYLLQSMAGAIRSG